MSEVLENTIYVSEKAKAKVKQLMLDAGVSDDPNYFLRVGVVGGGCSGLSYKLDFDNEIKPMDQVFEDNGVKIVTDLKSFLYLVNTELEFSDGLNGKGFYFNNPNAIFIRIIRLAEASTFFLKSASVLYFFKMSLCAFFASTGIRTMSQPAATAFTSH